MSGALAVLAGAAGGAAVAGAAAWWLAEARARRYGRLFSFAMHELNTPLTAVNMTVINLLSGVFGELPAEQRKWVEMTQEQVWRLSALVGEIRDLVHLELRRDLRSTVDDTDPAAIVREAAASARHGYQNAGVRLTLDIEEGLPAARVDSERAVRSLAGLLFHARKFRVGGDVTLRARRGGPGVVCEVAYDGLPLPRAQESLDLFYPARRRDDQVLAATGLGLGLPREVMRRVGGDLDFAVDARGRSVLSLSLAAAPGR